MYLGDNEVTRMYLGDNLVYDNAPVTGTTVYLLGRQSLITANTSTWRATQFSNNRYGIGEIEASGLAYVGNTLYTVGGTNEALYTLDPTTALATRIGTSVDFGVSESFPNRLASIGTTLYMTSLSYEDFNTGRANQGHLYTVNTTTGVATRIFTLPLSSNMTNSPDGIASIGTTLYVSLTVGGGANATLYSIDTTSSPLTLNRVGSVTNYNVGVTYMSALAVLNDSLYGIDYFTGNVYTIDTTTSIATRVGSTNLSFIADMAFAPETN